MKRLRIALMINELRQPAWVAAMLDEILASSLADLVLIVKRAAEPEPQKTLLQKILSRRRHLLYLAYSWIDRRIFPAKPDAFALEDIAPKLKGCPMIEVAAIRKKASEYFAAEVVEQIWSYDLDVIFRLGFGILRGDVLNSARYGVWSYHHGDPARYRGGPPGFWEVMEHNPVTGAMLQVLTEELDNGVVLDRGQYLTDPWSVNRNLCRYYWKAAPFALRALKRLAESGQAVAPILNTPRYEPYQHRLYKTPTNREMCWSMLSLARRYAVHKVQGSFVKPQWTVAYARTKKFPDTFNRFKPLLPPRDRFWADPFPLLHEGRHYIFIEELLFRRNLGHLSVIPLREDGTAGEPIKILEKGIPSFVSSGFPLEGRTVHDARVRQKPHTGRLPLPRVPRSMGTAHHGHA